jgi:acyl-CoA thioester hydrolase
MADYPFQFQLTHTVQTHHLDDMNHVNNVVYIQWVQDVAKAHWLQVGGDLLNKYVWVALRHEIDYLFPAVLHDQVELLTWVGKAEGARFERFIVVRHASSLREFAKAKTVWCMLDATSHKPRRITDEIQNVFK